jgi:hypothetical protein
VLYGVEDRNQWRPERGSMHLLQDFGDPMGERPNAPDLHHHVIQWDRMEGLGQYAQCQVLADLARAYGCPVAFEDNGVQIAYGEVMQKIAPDVKTICHTTGMNKRDPAQGVDQFEPLFTNRKISFHAAGAPPDKLKAMRDELVNWKGSSEKTSGFTDLIMALWIARFQFNLHIQMAQPVTVIRRAEQSGRISMYDKYLRHYFQSNDAEGFSGGAALNNYSDGRPALRAPGENGSGKQDRASPNYIKPIIKDLVAIRGVVPLATVPPASGEDADKDKATKITRALRQQYAHSAMTRQQQHTGFFLSCLGESCYTLDPRTPQMAKDDPDPFRPVGVYFNAINPKFAFPEFRAMSDDLEDLFWIVAITRARARKEFPHVRIGPPKDNDTELIKIIHYYSRTERQTIVDDQRAFGIVHNLGFCPAEWLTNEATDGRPGQSDIAGGVCELHSEVQDMWKVTVDSLVGSVYPIYHIHDAHLTSGQLEYGPGAQFETTGTAKLEVLAPQANPQQAQLIFGMALDNLMKQTGEAPVRIDNEIQGSNISARSVDRQQAPMEQRIKGGMALLGNSLERLNSKCLLMLSTIPDFKDEPMELYGQDKDGTYNETFTGADIGGWTRNVVKWESLTGSTQQQKVLQATQLYKEGMGMFPFEEVIVAAGYDDPSEIMERGKAEMAQKQAMQQPPGAPQPGNPESATQDQMSLAAGGGGGAPGGPPPGAGAPVQPPPAAGGPPPMPGFPAIASQPGSKGTPAPVPPIQEDVQAALASIQTRGGQPRFSIEGKQYIVYVPDHRDVPMVKAALAQVEQQDGIKITVKVGE